ncbi:MAG: 6-carboxytetrahydropterin synthase [bacterium]
MIKITKAFSFEAAHRLAKGYPDKCKNIHGHSFKGELTVNCSTLNHYDMGVDFAVLKSFLKQIEKHFDHKLILYENDHELIDFCHTQHWEVITLPHNPTSEVIATYIYQQAKKELEPHYPCEIQSVMIAETCSSRCVYQE